MGCTVDIGKKMKQNEELFQIAEKTKSSYMLHHVIIGQMYIDCYFRNYTRVVDYGEKNRTMRINFGERRVLDVFHVFFEGICKWNRFACSVKILVRFCAYPYYVYQSCFMFGKVYQLQKMVRDWRTVHQNNDKVG